MARIDFTALGVATACYATTQLAVPPAARAVLERIGQHVTVVAHVVQDIVGPLPPPAPPRPSLVEVVAETRRAERRREAQEFLEQLKPLLHFTVAGFRRFTG